LSTLIYSAVAVVAPLAHDLSPSLRMCFAS
jgi:hypothetical protein